VKLLDERWSPTHPPGQRLGLRGSHVLARLPAFAACTPRQLRRVSRWGDLLEVAAGQVLVREDHSDWWFFVVVSGRVALSRNGVTTGELPPGAHFGEVALIGLRPQPVTAVAVEPTVLFVLGPRYVLSLLSASRGFRNRVVPGVATAEFPAFAQRMHDVGQAEWRRLAAEHRAAAARDLPAQRGAPQRDRMPGRPLSLREAVAALAQLPPPQPTLPAGGPLRRSRWWLAVVAGTLTAIAGLLFGYHPPRLLLTAGRPIDVAADIRVSGAATFPPRGHYLMLWVKATQPNLAGYLTALVAGRTIVPLDQRTAPTDRDVGRQQYLNSQRTAIRLAVTAAGLDPRRVSVHIRDRGFLGPSAGLAYALAIEDLLTPADLTGGRLIGVTGELLPDGRVLPIGWLLLKARGAAQDHATLVVVPGGEATAVVRRVATTCGVTTFADSLLALTSRCGPNLLR
jgi:CRP-like cAMP-binding protein